MHDLILFWKVQRLSRALRRTGLFFARAREATHSLVNRALTTQLNAQTSNLQVLSWKPAETEDPAEPWGFDGRLILTAGGDGISSNGGLVSVIVYVCVHMCVHVSVCAPPV